MVIMAQAQASTSCFTNLHCSVNDILSHSRSDNFNHSDLRCSGLKKAIKMIRLEECYGLLRDTDFYLISYCIH